MHQGTRRRRPPISRNRAILWPVAIIAVCAGWKGSSSQEWKLESNISQRLLYSDNLLLGPDTETEAFGSITAPGLRLERTSPTSDIVVDGRFEFAEYLDHSEFNSQDQFLNLDVEQLLSERSTLRLDSNLTHDTTLKSEQDVTGRFLDEAIEFTSWRVGPSWSYLLSPIDEIILRGSYRQVAYDSAEKTDYQYFGPSIDYNHRLSEVDQITSSISAYRFIPDEPGKDTTDTVGTLLGYAYIPSERFSISGAAGVAYSMRDEDDTGSDDNDNSDVGYRLKLNLKYLMNDQTSARVSLSHDTEPSGDGDQVTRNRATAALNYKLTELTTLGLNVDYADSVDFLGFEGDSTTDEGKSRYGAIRPSVSWQLTEDLSLMAQYSYRYKVFEEDDDSASSNSVFLTLQYDLPTLIGDGF